MKFARDAGQEVVMRIIMGEKSFESREAKVLY